MTTATDQVIIDRQGIVGKHAGDGATAFFLAEELGSPSGAVAAAIEAARDIGVAVGTAAKEIADETGLIEASECLVNVGLHWGATLYMGQLVTGGRLEVTALGDEVNECARIQTAARDGQVLASKALLEHLDNEDARALRVNPDMMLYRTISEIPGAPDKSVKDAGGIPVTAL
jgi:class 3 adenylate cyclase